MTAAPRRQIKALQLGTALATTLLMGGLAAPAFGQVVPTITPGNEGGTTITPGTGTLQVDLNNGTRVVNWDTYSIGTGGSVSYITSNTGTQYAVLNRVITASPSQIDGLIAATNGGANNIAVWLTNPNGITFGSTGAFNGGALVLTTLGVTDTDFLDGNSTVNLTGASANGITIASGAALNTLGGSTQSNMLILAAQTMTVAGSLNSTGETALVAAQDVTLDTAVGSPLGITITTGTALSGVSVLGSVSGSSVKLAAANASAVMNTLLNVNSGASLTATGTNGAVVLATTTTGSIDRKSVV